MTKTFRRIEYEGIVGRKSVKFIMRTAFAPDEYARDAPWSICMHRKSVEERLAAPDHAFLGYCGQDPAMYTVQ